MFNRLPDAISKLPIMLNLGKINPSIGLVRRTGLVITSKVTVKMVDVGRMILSHDHS